MKEDIYLLGFTVYGRTYTFEQVKVLKVIW